MKVVKVIEIPRKSSVFSTLADFVLAALLKTNSFAGIFQGIYQELNLEATLPIFIFLKISNIHFKEFLPVATSVCITQELMVNILKI